MGYLASVVFVYGVTEYVGSGAANADRVLDLERLFGGLDWTLLTLFMSITGGTSWETAVYAMLEIHLVYGLLFVFFVAAMTLAALNIIAGIFVNDAIEMAQMDRDIVIQAESGKNRAMLHELRRLFLEFDTDSSGTLTRDELTEAWKNPEVSARFRMLGVEELDASTLFTMLDMDGTDEIDIHEFVTGCLRAKTLTRPMDIQTFVREIRRVGLKTRDQLCAIELRIDHLALKLDKEMQPRGPEREVRRPRSLWHTKREASSIKLKASKVCRSIVFDTEELDEREVAFPDIEVQLDDL